MNRLPTLVVFCRRPALGSGKRRLAGVLGEADAFEIANALLECTLEDAKSWHGALVISPAGAEDHDWAASLVATPARVQPQPQGNLGERLNAVDAAVRNCGDERLVFIGADAPSLAVADLLAAAAILDNADVVLGPAADGGVTLMGSRVPWPDLAGLPWSTPALGTALELHCAKCGLTVGQTPCSYDIDEASDLAAACRALGADERPARRRLHRLLTAAVERHALARASADVRA